MSTSASAVDQAKAQQALKPTPQVSSRAMLLTAVQNAHWFLEATMTGVDDELANRAGIGRTHSIGCSYAHAMLFEDAVVQGRMRRQAPLFATTWVQRTGVDKPMPFPGLVDAGTEDWYKTVRVDFAACRKYAKAVYALAERFLGQADHDTLNQPVDMSPYMATVPLTTAFMIFVVAHLNNHAGEISAMKGLHGLKGYPF